MKRIVLILSVFMGMMACQQEDGPKISDKYQELFKLSKETEDVITSSDEYKSLKKSLSGFAQYKEYYAAHGKAYQKLYSSMADNEELRMACVEYLMGQTKFLSGLHSNQRKELLCLSLDKQKIKFEDKDSAPLTTRQTGLQLIIRLLSIEKEEAILKALSDYCSTHEFQYGIYNDKAFHDFLVSLSSQNCKK
ncbi:hypothetical protein [Tannerella sp.]|uniref:hypothetical protein n=1 Tax=Tannerella sp. TaxID=2382127 RepID=UPI0026DD3ED4|nr:hypothetical protein [Tannerella sp.]MDO4702753.1 hypothetical protein [Tannerella sp.]